MKLGLIDRPVETWFEPFNRVAILSNGLLHALQNYSYLPLLAHRHSLNEFFSGQLEIGHKHSLEKLFFEDFTFDEIV